MILVNQPSTGNTGYALSERSRFDNIFIYTTIFPEHWARLPLTLCQVADKCMKAIHHKFEMFQLWGRTFGISTMEWGLGSSFLALFLLDLLANERRLGINCPLGFWSVGREPIKTYLQEFCDAYRKLFSCISRTVANTWSRTKEPLQNHLLTLYHG